MPSFPQLTAVAALLPLSLALPAGSHSLLDTVSFSVKQIYNPNFSEHNGPAAYKKATAKYNLQVASKPASSIKAQMGNNFLAAPGDAETKGIDSNDLQYLTPITVDGKQYLLDFDTGSSNLWIGGAKTGAKNKYTPRGKAVAGPAWTVAYGDGTTASGDVYSETVVIGETTVTSVAVGHATQAPASFFLPGANGQPGADGLLGLAFSANNTFQPQQKTWFDQAVSQGLPAVFAANLMPGTVAGSYDFGQLNKASYTGEIQYVDTDTSSGYWIAKPTKGDAGVMDTGTTLILLAEETTKAYYSQPEAVAAGAKFNADQSQWEFNCNSTLPDFKVEFAPNQAIVPGAFLNYNPLENGRCYSAIQNRDPSLPFSIYGDRFLMAVYAVFDQRSGTPRIGFADKTGPA